MATRSALRVKGRLDGVAKVGRKCLSIIPDLEARDG